MEKKIKSKKVKTSDKNDSDSFYIVEIRKYISFPYTEFSCLFLSNSLQKTIDFVKADENADYDKSYHWYWVIIKMKLNDETGGEIVKVFDKNGNETTERIMLKLD